MELDFVLQPLGGMFTGKKNFNVIMFNDTHSIRIYDILCQAPGSFHDAAIWGQSDFLAWFRTEFPHKFILGDSAYP